MKIILRINMLANMILSPLGLMAFASKFFPIVGIARRPTFTAAQIAELRRIGRDVANEQQRAERRRLR